MSWAWFRATDRRALWSALAGSLLLHVAALSMVAPWREPPLPVNRQRPRTFHTRLIFPKKDTRAPTWTPMALADRKARQETRAAVTPIGKTKPASVTAARVTAVSTAARSVEEAVPAPAVAAPPAQDSRPPAMRLTYVPTVSLSDDQDVMPGSAQLLWNQPGEDQVLDEGRERPGTIQEFAGQLMQLAQHFASGQAQPTPGSAVSLMLGGRGGVVQVYDILDDDVLDLPRIGVVRAIHLKARQSDLPGSSESALVAEVWLAANLHYLPIRIRLLKDVYPMVDLRVQTIEQE